MKYYELYHKKRINIYDKNKDNLITIKEFLDKELSKGPKAEKSNIGYKYDNPFNIYVYFMILIKDFKKYKILCIPNTVLNLDKTNIMNSYQAAVVYIADEKKIYISNEIRKLVNNCINQKEIRFIYFEFGLKNKKEDLNGHSNFIIIDLKKKTLELFEPHGYYIDDTSKYIDNVIIKKILKKLNLSFLKYIPPSNLSPKIGIQRTGDAFCGMCMTINMMYLHMRLLNPDIDQKKIVNYFVYLKKKKLINMILRYAKQVEKKLKKNDKYYKKLFDEFYNKLIKIKDKKLLNYLI